MDTPMMKTKMLMSESKNLPIITSILEVNVEDWEVLLKTKVDVNIEKKNTLKVVKKCGMRCIIQG